MASFDSVLAKLQALPPPPSTYTSEPKQKAALALYEAQIQVVMEQHKVAIAAELEAAQDIQKAYIAVLQGAIDRARAGAEFIQKGAAAIGTLYAGLIGLTYGAAKDSTPLPIEGLVPGALLALAIVFATVYLAYVAPTKRDDAGNDPADDTPSSFGQLRRDIVELITYRAPWLQRGIWCLGLGVLTLPLPYLQLDVFRGAPIGWTIGMIGVSIAIAFAIPRIWHWKVDVNMPSMAPLSSLARMLSRFE